MAEGSIYWTKPWNPVVGCGHHSKGCNGCWAERITVRMAGQTGIIGELARQVVEGGGWNGNSVLVDRRLDDPIRWTKPQVVATCWMGDLFAKRVPDSWINRVIRTMCLAPRHRFLVLTKRSDRMAEHMSKWSKRQCSEAPRNILFGASICTPDEAERHMTNLAKILGRTWLSVEPLIGPVDFTGLPLSSLDWLVLGGESGPRARSCLEESVRTIRDQTVAAGVPFFFKQWSGRVDHRRLDGKVWSERPSDLVLRLDGKSWSREPSDSVFD